MSKFIITANITDILSQTVFLGRLTVMDGKIKSIETLSATPDPQLPFLVPGFIDSHVHIESSMLVPAQFARLAVVHGTVATVSDPHEIANVCGLPGVEFMINNGKSVNFKFYFGAPSCVPATTFETAGAALTSSEVRELLQRNDIRYLSEMMNFPGVINKDPDVMQKIAAAHSARKPVDGHAPGLGGASLIEYAAAGISTDHECFTKEEALEKLALGMKVIIREGSAARNFDALVELLHDHAASIMFCSDDKHPDSLVKGHMNELCRRAVQKGVNVFHVLKAACINPVLHYRLEVGILRPDDHADFILLKDLSTFEVLETYINGERVAANGISHISSAPCSPINQFRKTKVEAADLLYPADRLLNRMLPVIEALDGQLITRKLMLEPLLAHDIVLSDPSRDILKIVVVNRYYSARPAVAFIKNFGFRQGAIASSVAHDSHNIIAVGADDESLVQAIRLVSDSTGGVSCVTPGGNMILPLPVAGLMSDEDGYAVARAYTEIDLMAKSLGSTLAAPFMTLSFMALLVIPALKLSDLGLFDGERFEFLHSR